MRPSESPLESYKLKRILFFDNLICSSVSGLKALKKYVFAFAIFSCSEKLKNIFEIGLRKCGVIVQKSLSEKKYFERKNFAPTFLLFIC